MEKSVEFIKLMMNFDLFSNKIEIPHTLSFLDQKVDEFKNSDIIFYRKEIFSNKISTLQFTILDFECNPPKMAGIYIGNRIYQFYIKNQGYLSRFFDLVLEILFLLKEFYLFCFSNHEFHVINEVMEFFNSRSEKDTLPISFVRKLKLVNVQKFNFEGLIPALYSIDKEVYDDPLLRDSKKVNLHFKKGHYDLILDHNKSCLMSILTLVKSRYLKETLV